MSCGAVHSQARELLERGYAATLVAGTLRISRSSLYYQRKPHSSRADRRYDEQIVLACGEKVAYVNRKRVLRVITAAPEKSWAGISRSAAGPQMRWRRWSRPCSRDYLPAVAKPV